MEPRIQYAKTKDGVSIAYWTLGEGPALVQTPDIPISLSAQWQVPELRAWYERLTRKRKVITYDPRGCGLSERHPTETRPDYTMHDLEAVADALAIEHFSLLGVFRNTPYAIAYAAHHPERVSRLILYSPTARIEEVLSTTKMSTMLRMLGGDFKSYLDTILRVTAGLSSGERLRQLVSLIQQSVTPEIYARWIDALTELDVSDLLGRVQSPTLVLHRIGLEIVNIDMVREVCSTISGARLNLLDGEVLFPWLGDAGAVLDAIDEFLGEGEEAAEAEAPEAGAFRTVLFTDVEGSTALTQRLGDAKARDVLRQHERIVREALKSHAGAELKTMGDGFMASFSSATRALESAIAMQRAFAAHNKSAEEPILVRVGLNAGEPIAEEADLFGTAVIEAARIAAAAKGGEILVSDVVRQLAKGKDFLFADRGEVALRGFDEPVRLYELRWQD